MYALVDVVDMCQIMDSMKKIQLIKDLLKEIHSSVDPVKLRERFKEILQRASPCAKIMRSTCRVFQRDFGGQGVERTYQGPST
ncbi:MAG: hypothetical protein QXU13_04435 [Desulfurococcaceae archaeon]